jgi:hypothetical protein
MRRKTYNLVLLLDALALALGRRAALGVAAAAGRMVAGSLRAVVAIESVASIVVVVVVDDRSGRDILGVESLEPLGGDVRVLAHDLALEGGL